MAPVLFGLDLADLAWYKFGNEWMFKNNEYHLRRTKFIIYQLAMIFCVLSESLGTAALSGQLQHLLPACGDALEAGRVNNAVSTDYCDRLR